MAWHDQDHVITCDGIIIWEAVTKPDVSDKDQSLSWNLRVAVDPNAPEVAELRQLRDKALRESKKPNVNPGNPGNDPIMSIDAAKFPEIPSNWLAFSAGTKQGAPTVCNAAGLDLQPMTYGPQLYNGAIVRLLVHAYAYDNKQRGINYGLDGVQIINSQAPRLSIGAVGMSKDAVKGAFGGAPAAGQTPPPAPGAVSVDFPPAGWLAHPSAPGFFYKGQEVLSEADLRAKFPVAPPVSTQPPPPPQQQQSHQPPPPPHTGYMDQPAPPAAAAPFPPAGWWPHPGAPGSFYNAANEVVTEAALRARVGA